jgi:hypothetical protein
VLRKKTKTEDDCKWPPLISEEVGRVIWAAPGTEREDVWLTCVSGADAYRYTADPRLRLKECRSFLPHDRSKRRSRSMSKYPSISGPTSELASPELLAFPASERPLPGGLDALLHFANSRSTRGNVLVLMPDERTHRRARVTGKPPGRYAVRLSCAIAGDPGSVACESDARAAKGSRASAGGATDQRVDALRGSMQNTPAPPNALVN